MNTTNTPNTTKKRNEGVKENTRSPIQKTILTPKQIVLSLLKARAWKQVDLADKIGISRQALNNYLSGRWGVPTQIKIKIAQALEVDSSVIWDLGAKNG